MKWNRYNAIIENGDQQYLLYNCATDNLMVFIEEIKKIIEENIHSIDRIKKIHPPLFKYLLDKDFIIDDQLNETKIAIEKKEKKLNTESYFRLTLNPTMDCNLKCWYCYETHEPNSRVSREIMKSIKLLIKNKIENPKIKKIVLSFFGGEPLLEFESTILPLIFYTKELCDLHTKELSLGFTTNAVLLTPEVIDIIASTGLKVHIQVPFDGGEKYHNKIKKNSSRKGTYNITISNIKYAMKKEFSVSIRCNYTLDNIDSFEELIDRFKDDCSSQRNFRFSFQPIWQTSSDEKLVMPKVKKLGEILEEYKINYNDKRSSVFASACYADRPDSIVVNYNGNIYKCTAQDFIPEYREGVLNKDGTITYNERYTDRMGMRFSSEACQKCSILPICNTCSQKKLNQFLDTTCARGISEEDKYNIIKSRVELISDNKIEPVS
jgi:uncharacterized protein